MDNMGNGMMFDESESGLYGSESGLEDGLELDNEADERMSDSELATYCLNQINACLGEEDDEVESNRSNALDYYFGRLPQPAKTVSTVVSMDVMDSVEATVSEIMPAFTGDNVAIFEPKGEDDQEQARIETELVNYLFSEEYNGFNILQTALKDALLQRNCSAKIYWSETLVPTYETHEDVPIMGLPQLLAPQEGDESVEIIEQIVTEQSVTIIEPQTGMHMQQDASTVSVRLKRIKKKAGPRIESIAPEEMKVIGWWRDPDIGECPFVAHEIQTTEDALVAEGYNRELVESLPSYVETNEDTYSRNRTSYENGWSSQNGGSRPVQIYECYPIVDADGDGLAERMRVVIGGNQVMSREEWDTNPLVSGTTRVMPHRYMGISLFDRQQQVQDSKTKMLRIVEDGSQIAARGRIGVVTEKVNVDDVLTSYVGGIVRMRDNKSVVPFPTPDVPATSYKFLEYMDKMRRERGGSATDDTSPAFEIGGDTAHGIERLMSTIEQNNALCAKTFGESFVRGVFLALHDLLRKHMRSPVRAQINGQWVDSVPAEWRPRNRVSIAIGSSQGERQRKAAALNQIYGAQMSLYEKAPDVMVTGSDIYNTLTDMTRALGVRNPARYWQDPESPKAKQAAEGLQKQAAQQSNAQQQAQVAMIDAQVKIAQAQQIKETSTAQINMMKQKLSEAQAYLKQAETDENNRYKYEKMFSDIAMELTKLEQEYGVQLDAEYNANEVTAK